MDKIQVALSKVKDLKTGNLRVCKYSDIPTDINGWVLNLKYMPIPFDMMYVRLKNKPKVISAWWNGQNWEGLRMREGDEVINWKRNHDYD